MLHPSYTDLIEAINSGVEPGEQPVVQSRYSIVIAAAKRARQLIDGADPLISGAAGKKPLSTAVQELYEKKVTICADSQDEEEEETHGLEPEAVDEEAARGALEETKAESTEE